MRKSAAGFSLLALAMLLAPLLAQAQMRVWTADPLTRVQPTSPAGSSTAATLKAARNEYEAVQVVVQAPSSGSLNGVNVAVSDLTGPGTIAKSNISLFRAHYIPVTIPTAWRDMNSPNPPGDWPDALVPSTVPGGTYRSFPFSVTAGKNQPVWVEVYVPQGTPAGTYTGTITVTATGNTPVTVPLTLVVWGFTLPAKPVLASDFWGYDLWMSEACQAITGETCSTLRENIITDLRRHRVGAGMTGTAPFPNATVDSILARQARIQVQSMSDANLQQLVAAYGSKQLYMYATDEPQTQAEIDAVNDPSGTVQRYRRNGVPALITVSWSQEGATHDIGWDANVDIFVAVHFKLMDFTKAQQKLNAGKEVWSYTTAFGPNTVPSWALDYDLINERIVPWLDYSKGLTGFLFWTPVFWCPNDPWTNGGPRPGATCWDGSSNRNGVVFYYPGDVVGAPNAAIPAARLKAIRDGVEDYDYLTLLARVDAAKAKSLAQNLAPAFDKWNHDPAALLAAREQVAAAILGVTGDVTPPVISSVSATPASSTATVSWTTNEAADSQVEYGPTGSYGASTSLDSARATSHTVALTGLGAGTLYHYRVKSRDAAGNLATSPDATFTTTGGTATGELVGHWGLDETSGTVANDASGKGNHGALVNGPKLGAGKLGGGLSFDGVDDAVTVLDSASLDSAGAAFTVAAWINGSDADDGVDDDRVILGKGDTGWTIKNSFIVSLDDDKRLTMQIANGTSLDQIGGTTALRANAWYHVAGVFDGNRLSLYVNGVSDATPVAKTIAGSLVNSGTLAIGRQSAADSASPYNSGWKGILDDVRVYNRALTASEIEELFDPTGCKCQAISPEPEPDLQPGCGGCGAAGMEPALLLGSLLLLARGRRTWRKAAAKSAINSILMLAVLLAPSAQAADRYVAPSGQDIATNGTASSPWKTFTYAVSQLSSGDVLRVGAGVYYERSAIEIAKSNIQIIGSGGALIDASYPELQRPNTNQWELWDASKGIYRSKSRYSGAGYVAGSFVFQGTEYRLVTYADLNYAFPLARYDFLRSDNEYATSTGPVYVGPGVFFDRGGVVDPASPERIYIRMKKSKYMTSEYSALPGDPNQLVIYLAPLYSTIRLRSASGVVVRDIKLRKGINISAQSRDIALTNVVIAQAAERAGWGVFAGDGSDQFNLTLDNVAFESSNAPWVAWEDVKNGNQPAYNMENLAVILASGVHHVVIKNCVFNRGFDGVYAVGNAHDIKIFNSKFQGVRDDPVTLGTSTYEVEVYNNVIRGSGAGVSRFGTGSSLKPGTKYIHHNIIDASESQRVGRADASGNYSGWHAGPYNDGMVWLEAFGSHVLSATGSDGDPRMIYNNTCLIGYNPSIGVGYDLHGIPTRNVTNPQSVYNNIFVQVGEGPIQVAGLVNDGSLGSDGNLFYRVNTASAKPLFGSSWYSLGAMQSATGLDKTSLYADPKLNGSYAPGNLTVVTGGVDIRALAPDLPGVDGIYRGAVRPGSDPGDAGAPDAGGSGDGGAPDAGGADGGSLRARRVTVASLDGRLDEGAWAEAAAVSFKDPLGTSDNRVNVRALWTDERLYFGYEVNDQSVEATATSTTVWREDGVELFLDPAGDQGTAMQPDDVHLIVNAAGAAYFSRGTGSGEAQVAVPATVQRAVSRTASGYQVEIGIAWSELGLSAPKAGTALGVLLAANDLDGTSFRYFDWLNLAKWAVPQQWGRLQLEESADADAGAPDGGGTRPGLVGHWKLDDASGTLAADLSGNGNSGTLLNGPKWCAGKVGGALTFDGVDDAVTVSDSANLDSIGAAFTVAAWINGTDPDDGVDDDRVMLGKGDTGWAVKNTLVLGLDKDKRLSMKIGDGSSLDQITGTMTLKANEWYHVAGVFDGSRLSLYVNGVSDATPKAKTIAGSLVNSGTLALGRQSAADSASPYNSGWKGILDDVRVYNRALTASEIEELFDPTGCKCQAITPKPEPDLQPGCGGCGVAGMEPALFLASLLVFARRRRARANATPPGGSQKRRGNTEASRALRKAAGWIFVVVLATLATPRLALAQTSSGMEVWVETPLVRVQPTDPPKSSNAAILKAARNEYEAIHVIVRAPSAASLSGVNVAVSDLTGPGTIAKSNIRLYRAHYVPVTQRTCHWKQTSVCTPNLPGDWPDAMIPSTVPGGTYQSFPFSVSAGKNQPVYVEVYIPKGTNAGTYTGTITVTATGQSPISVPLSLTVWGFALPDKPTLASHFWGYDLWMSKACQAITGETCGVLRENILADLRRHRIGAGAVGASESFPNSGVDAILSKQSRIEVSSGMTAAKLEELSKAYGSKQLYAAHRDEPQTQDVVEWMNDPNGEVQRYRANGVPEMLTISWSGAWSANVDIYVPHHYFLDPNYFYWSQGQKAYELLKAGKQVWSYTCCGISSNGDVQPTWSLDFDLIHFRIVPWLDYMSGFTGFLFWTPVNWCPGDPWLNKGSGGTGCVGDVTNVNGRGVFYYTGDKVGAPNAAIPSARIKAIRDGVEDYEYLNLLATLGDPALAISLAKTPAPSWNTWSRNAGTLVAAREQAAARILQLSGTSPDVTPPLIASVAAAPASTTATVTWMTDEAADSQVEYGPTSSYGTSSPLDGERVTSHAVTLVGLTPGALYHFRVKSKDAGGNPAASPDSTFSTDSTVTPSGDLVGHWQFEETSGTAASDSSGKANHGALVNGPKWGSGKLGGGLSFDGVDDALTVADSSSLDSIGVAFTVAAWINGADPADGINDDRVILGKGDLGQNVKNTFVLGLDNDKRLSLRIADGMSLDQITATTALKANEWYHVAGVFDGSRLSLYVNGVSDATPKAKTIGGSLVNSGTLALGRQSAADSASPYNSGWKGMLDDVRVYNRALSAEEISELYDPTGCNCQAITPEPEPDPQPGCGGCGVAGMEPILILASLLVFAGRGRARTNATTPGGSQKRRGNTEASRALRKAAGGLFVVVLATLAAPRSALAQTSSGIQVWVENPLVRVQPADPPKSSNAATLKAARNEYEAVQVIVRAPSAASLSGVNVTVSDLTGPGTIAKSNIHIYRAHYIPVRTRSYNPNGNWGSPYPPGDWADALVPTTVPGGTYPSFPFTIAAGKNQPVWVEIYVPKGTPAGAYIGAITVSATGQSSVTVPLNLTAWEFSLPDYPALASDFWGFDYDMNINAAKSVGSDRATLAAALHADLRAHKLGNGETTPSKGPFPTASVDAILQTQTRAAASYAPMSEADAKALVAAYGRNRLYGYHADEPGTVERLNQINDPNGQIQRNRRAGIPEMIPFGWSWGRCDGGLYIGWCADVDIYTVHVDILAQPADYARAQEKQRSGKEVWSYLIGPSPDRFPEYNLDYDGIYNRISPWINYSTGFTGILYYTPVNWCGGNPWLNEGGSCPGQGDSNKNMLGVLYYPGHMVGAPNAAIPSARLKRIRDGVEDYDYLSLLAKAGDSQLAAAIAKSLAPAWGPRTYEPAALLAAREEMAARIVQLAASTTDTTPPVMTGVSAAPASTTATVTWATDEAADSQAEYGPTSSHGTSSPLDGERVTSHAVTLIGLTPGALYRFRVKSRDAAGNLAVSPDATFTTAGGTANGDLVGHWQFDETAGTVANDTSGKGNHGTLVNGPMWNPGKLGGALSFDGVDDSVTVADSASLDSVGGAFTVAAWIDGTDPDDGVDDDRVILGKGDIGWTIKNSFILSLDDGKRLTMQIADGTSLDQITATTALKANAWYHVAGVFDGSRLSLYVNGVSDATPRAKTIGGSLVNSGTLALGRQSAADSASPYNSGWKGMLDDLRVYNRALSAEEISELYDPTGCNCQAITPEPEPDPQPGCGGCGAAGMEPALLLGSLLLLARGRRTWRKAAAKSTINSILIMLAVLLAPSAQAADHYVAPGGQDIATNGTASSPWKTFTYAVSRLSSGDILHVGAGAYYERNIIDIASKNNIQIVGEDGALIDASYPELQKPNTGQWELWDAAKGIYRSKSRYFGAGWVGGSFVFQGMEYRLVAYTDINSGSPRERYDALSTDKEYRTVGGGNADVYVGPGVFFDKSGVVDSANPERIYIRMKRSVYMTGAYAAVPSDPNQSVIYLSPGASWIYMVGSSGVTINNIKVRDTMIITNSHDVALGNMVVHQGAIRWGIIAVDTSYNLTFDNITFESSNAPWVAWDDIKNWVQPAYNMENILLMLQNGTRDMVIKNSIFNRGFLGVYAVGNIYNVKIFSNRFNGIRDDAVVLGTSTYEMDVYNNIMKGAGATGVARLGSGNSLKPGTKYIHHNIIDSSEPQRVGRADTGGNYYDWHAGPYKDGMVWLEGFGSHDLKNSGSDGDPRMIYNNTVLIGYAENGIGYGRAGLPSTNLANPQRVYNNMFVQVGEGPIMVYGLVTDGTLRSDGNLFFRMNAASVKPLFGSSWYTLSAMQSATRLDAASVYADPQLNASYVPGNSSAVSGGVNIGALAPAVPGVDGIYRGAVRPGTDPWGGDGGVGDGGTADGGVGDDAGAPDAGGSGDGGVLVARRIAAGNVDGRLEETAWAEAAAVSFGDPQAKSDNRVSVRALWTAEHLYLGYEVSDQSVEATAASGKPWEEDSVELFVDPAGDRGATMHADDIHLIVSAADATYFARGTGSGQSQLALPPTVQRAVSRTATGFQVEVGLPWSELGVANPARGMAIGVLFTNNDLDGPSYQYFDWLGLPKWGVPEQWGQLVLEDGSTPGDGGAETADGGTGESGDPSPRLSPACGGCGAAGMEPLLLLSVLMLARRRFKNVS